MRKLKFDFEGNVVEAGMVKIDRWKLYGSVDVQALGPNGDECRMADLADDGKTLIGKGGAGMGVLSLDGDWISRKDLTPVTPEGVKITPVVSSFSAPVTLEKSTVEECLSHQVRSAYQLRMDHCLLLEALQNGEVFKFNYSYRGGISYDTAFLLANPAGTPFMLVGEPSELEMIGMSEEAVIDEKEDEDEDEDDLDFSMM